VTTKVSTYCKKDLRDSWIYFDYTILRLGLGKLFPARGSLESDILVGDRNTAIPFLTVQEQFFLLFFVHALSNVLKMMQAAGRNVRNRDLFRFKNVNL